MNEPVIVAAISIATVITLAAIGLLDRAERRKDHHR